MNQSIRLRRLEAQIVNRQCQTCWGARSLIVHVPSAYEKELPQYNPTHCVECGEELQNVRQIIGVSEEAAAGILARSTN